MDELSYIIPVDESSYVVPESSMSELEVSYIPPTYSPVHLSDGDCNSPPRIERVLTSSLIEASADPDQQVAVDLNTNVRADVSTLNMNGPSLSPWSGFKIVMDNVDKNFRPRYQRVGHTTKSLHCVHMFASKDRIDLSSFSNSRPLQANVTPNDILPSSSDLTVIKEHFKVLVSRFVLLLLQLLKGTCLCLSQSPCAASGGVFISEESHSVAFT